MRVRLSPPLLRLGGVLTGLLHEGAWREWGEGRESSGYP